MGDWLPWRRGAPQPLSAHVFGHSIIICRCIICNVTADKLAALPMALGLATKSCQRWASELVRAAFREHHFRVGCVTVELGCHGARMGCPAEQSVGVRQGRSCCVSGAGCSHPPAFTHLCLLAANSLYHTEVPRCGLRSMCHQRALHAHQTTSCSCLWHVGGHTPRFCSRWCPRDINQQKLLAKRGQWLFELYFLGSSVLASDSLNKDVTMRARALVGRAPAVPQTDK